MATINSTENGATLPFAALQLLAPPVRLVSAALWKVLKQRDVMQYGVVEEFVTSSCETVPGLLTLRHRGKLTLGLRARLILELCRTQPDAEVITPHLERIRVPSAPLRSPACAVKKDVKIVKTVESFHSLIHMLLTDPAKRERFYKEKFLVEYGSKFDQELEKVLWEFLIRLDQLLPVPSLAQTVSWLSETPAVLEECAQAATQPQLLKLLLQHQTCLGHLESAASLPPNMGDSILASLSLPLSGQVMSNPQTGSSQSSTEHSNGPHPGESTSFITPVIGLISNENVPVMISSPEKTLQGDEATTSKFTSGKQGQNAREGGVKKGQGQVEEEGSFHQSGSVKRKQAEDKTDSEGNEEEDVFSTASWKNGKKQQRISKSEENEAISVKKPRELLAAYLSEHNVGKLHLPEDPALLSVFTSCLSRKPKVVVEKLSLASLGSSTSGNGGKFFYKKQKDQRKSSPRKQTSACQTPQHPGMDDKENQPVLSSLSSPSSLQRSNADESYVADSEDEATKNFKGRLFAKCYYRTKHGTYVPTLREFWKPGATQRVLLSAARRRR